MSVKALVVVVVMAKAVMGARAGYRVGQSLVVVKVVAAETVAAVAMNLQILSVDRCGGGSGDRGGSGIGSEGSSASSCKDAEM